MLLEVLIFFLSVIVYLIIKIYKAQQKWQKMGIKVPPVSFPIGNNPVCSTDVFLGKKNVSDVAKNQYQLMQGERFYGTYFLQHPTLVICDPEVVKQITARDFNHFSDRVMRPNSRLHGIKGLLGNGLTDQIWERQLLNATGDQWKSIRSKISPIFTSGKMKMMVSFIEIVAARLLVSFKEEADNGREFELMEKFGKFSMDTIASCAFGMNAQSFTNPNSAFVKNAMSIMKKTPSDMIKILFTHLPGGLSLLNLLGISVFKPDEITFFHNVITETLKIRKNLNLKQNDLIDMILDAIKSSSFEEKKGHPNDEAAPLPKGKMPFEFDEVTFTANVLVMLVAGYDTTALALSYTAYELAKNPEIQKRLQDEIDHTIDEDNGNVPSYNKIQSMEYLDMVFHETLRCYPAMGAFPRVCVKDYQMPDSNVFLKAGEEVSINMAGIHSDPKHYPEPEKFNPEHFSKENKANRHPYAFLGFGQGPRSCIGMRFALLEAKMALISLLSKFNFDRCSRTVEHVVLDPASVLGGCKGGLWIKVNMRRN